MKADNLPQKWNLYKFTGLPYFNYWPEGAKANKFYEEMKKEYDEIKNKKLNGCVGTICWLVSYFVLIFCAGKLLFYDWMTRLGSYKFTFCIAILPAIFLIIGHQHEKKEKAARNSFDRAISNRQEATYKYTDIFIEPLVNKLMSGYWRSFRTGTQCIIYGNDGLIYFNTHDSTLVAYNKSNIKDVVRERIHLGASTNSQISSSTSTYTYDDNIGSGVRASSNTNTSGYSNTTDYYEWHLDIFTDFIDYPKVSLVLDDSPSTENAIGEIYAILKP